MREGEHIKNFHKEISVENNAHIFKLKYRVIKHMVEQRKADGYAQEDIAGLFSRFATLIDSGNYKIIPDFKNKKKLFFVEVVQEGKEGVILILEVVFMSDNAFYVVTGFYRALRKVKKLLK